MAKNKPVLDKFDLRSVSQIFTGAAPLGGETADELQGELVVKAPSVVLGYLNNEKANKETFQDGWMRTGDEAVVRKGPKGTEHIFIVDRIKELIKVKVEAIAGSKLRRNLC